jgi:hypothetical protein
MAQFIRLRLTTFQTPLTDRFIGHDNSSVCQKLFPIAKTERETKVQPNSVADDFRWKAKAFWEQSCLFSWAILAQCSVTFPI